MASDKNEVNLVGQLANIEIKTTQNNIEYAKFSVGVNETYIDKDKVEHKKIHYHNVSSFNKDVVAELKTLDAKSQNYGIVKGSLEYSSYEKDGKTIYTTNINAKGFEVADKEFAKENKQEIDIQGRLAKDVEIKTTKSNREFATFSVATNEYYKGQNDVDWKSKTQFHNVTVYEKDAVESLKGKQKGQPLELKGELSVNEFEKKDGTKGRSTEVLVKNKNALKILEIEKTVDKSKNKEQEVGMDR